MVSSMIDGQMEKLEELLPGIEEFLCKDLAAETLTEETENKRLYYLERLDILKLPPTIPPRLRVPEFGAPVHPPSPIKAECSALDVATIRSPQGSVLDVATVRSPTLSADFNFDESDFAAYQREISRSFITQEDHEEEGEKEVKVYDDIDTDSPDGAVRDNNDSKLSDDTDLYEIPVLKTTSDTTPPSPIHPATDGYEETSASPRKDSGDVEVNPPPLPPRRDRTPSDCPSRGSLGSLIEEKPPDLPPDLPVRPNLPSKLEIYNMTEKGEINPENKSENSVDVTGDLTDDADLTSYESCDEEEKDIQNKLNFKLPKPLKKTKKSKRLSKSRSSKEWDVTVPYSCLDEVTLSGEVHYKGKLSWTRKLAALTEGRMVCYKPEKPESKPSLVLQLTGYEASVCDTTSRREGKKGFDIRMIHPSLETHMFSADFKDWAQMWCEYINAMSQGKPPPGQYHHLARTTFTNLDSSRIYGSKSELRKSTSNVSSSSNDLDTEYSSLKRRSKKERNRVTRMGSIAQRATQFFENIGKKKEKVRQTQSMPASCSLDNLQERSDSPKPQKIHLSATAPVTPNFDLDLIGCIRDEDKTDDRIQHQGHLQIYSSFNKRRWGKRWCLVRENRFECYRHRTSGVCELDFPLRDCVLRRAVDETKSELGLMLTENNTEKITVEPLSASQMAGWLRVFMNETMTEKLPEGLGEFWVEEESPYHVIRPEEVHSPTSDGYQKVNDTSPQCIPESPYDFGDDCAFDETDTTSSTLINQSNSIDQSCDSSAIATTSTDNFETHIPGEVTGDLYTQVQRRSSAGSAPSLDCQSPSLGDGNTFTSSVHSKSFSNKNGRLTVQSVKSSKTVTSTGRVASSMFSYSQTFSSKFANGNHGELFSEILSKINDNFRPSLSDDQPDDGNVSDGNVDTAYNSACCSENSSLERKSHTEVNRSTQHLELDTVSQGTDYQVSPMEENLLHSDIQNSNINQSISEVINQSNCAVTVIDNEVIKCNVKNQESDQSHFSSTVILEENGNKPSTRDQCDSAIFESESILDDVTGGREALVKKIEQLRTHLVELKKNRIHLRDRKAEMVTDMERQNVEEEYQRLDEECHTVSQEITILEQHAIATTSTDNFETHIPGEVTGDLYTQVQRRSSAGSAPSLDCQSPSLGDGNTFTSSVHSKSFSNKNGRLTVQSVKSSKTVTSTGRVASSMFSYSQTFSSKFANGNHGELFSEILSKINDNFRPSLSDDQPDDGNVSDGNVDTAYNSACCSENSSLERKSHTEVNRSTQHLELDTVSQGTDYQVSPMEENLLHSDIQNSNINQSISEVINQSNCAVTVIDNEVIKCNVKNQESDQSHFSSTVILEENGNKPSIRDQCDSAIFESESILDDVTGGREALVKKIEQLRTHLVELKKNRIHLRDRKAEMVTDMERQNVEEEYLRLDEECHTVSQEITILEQQLPLI